jgi:hypothetical protein
MPPAVGRRPNPAPLRRSGRGAGRRRSPHGAPRAARQGGTRAARRSPPRPERFGEEQDRGTLLGHKTPADHSETTTVDLASDLVSAQVSRGVRRQSRPWDQTPRVRGSILRGPTQEKLSFTALTCKFVHLASTGTRRIPQPTMVSRAREDKIRTRHPAQFVTGSPRSCPPSKPSTPRSPTPDTPRCPR